VRYEVLHRSKKFVVRISVVESNFTGEREVPSERPVRVGTTKRRVEAGLDAAMC
jgi:hypothetical protein